MVHYRSTFFSSLSNAKREDKERERERDLFAIRTEICPRNFRRTIFARSIKGIMQQQQKSKRDCFVDALISEEEDRIHLDLFFFDICITTKFFRTVKRKELKEE
jgi:hypothetical protein